MTSVPPAPGGPALPAAATSGAAAFVLEILKQKLSQLQHISPSEVWQTVSQQALRVQSWGKYMRPMNYSRPPQTMADWFSRVFSNVKENSSHYAVIYAFFFVYALITSPFLLFSMALVGAMYVYAFHVNPNFSIGGVQPTAAQKYIGFALITLVLFFLTSASSTLFWVFSISTLLVVIHATFYTPAYTNDNPFGAPTLPIAAPLTGEGSTTLFPAAVPLQPLHGAPVPAAPVLVGSVITPAGPIATEKL